MAGRRKIPLIKGESRIRYNKAGEKILVQSTFCGECGRVTQATTIQIGEKRAKREDISRTVEVARCCANVEAHKNGEKHLWPLKNVMIPIY